MLPAGGGAVLPRSHPPMTKVNGPRDIYSQGHEHVHLKIGECIFTKKPILISTVLGSCVAVTFYDPKSHASAMFHAMLPDSRMEKNPGKSCKYVDTSIDGIMARFARLGIKPGRLVAKLFGGAFTIQPERKVTLRNVVDVGAKNVDMARIKLKEYNLDIASENVLGEHGRKVFFYTGTGEVWMKYVSADSKEGRMDATPV